MKMLVTKESLFSNRKFGVLIILLAFYAGDIAAQSSELIRKKCEEIIAGHTAIVFGEPLYANKLLPQFYQERQFYLAWEEDFKSAFINTLDNASDHGLDESDYHYEIIQEIEGIGALSPTQKAELDLLLTDAYLMYASHLLNGKVNPETVDSEWKAIRREGNAKDYLNEVLQSAEAVPKLKILAPEHESYDGLMTGLRTYLNLRDVGGWSMIPDGETLKVGMTDSVRVPLLIERLIVTDDLPKSTPASTLFSSEISAGVKVFQARHGLEEDGNVGKQTLAALNVPIDHRVEQIKANLERLRWINQDLGKHFVFVNIANYRMRVIKDGATTFEERVIVGKPFRKTPVFSGRMSYMVVNPTWTIPPTILFNDILPETKKNPGYLNTKNIRVIAGQGSNAKILDPFSIDWAKLSKSNFPYTLRQDPGPTNALGLVKFMFPNSYNVYIHDTPSRELFARTDRAFSSGCIRLNNPLTFAKYLLENDASWTDEKFETTLKAGLEKSIILSQPLNVHILYLTAWTENGKVQFRNDIYDRDQAVIDALNTPAPSLP